MSKDGVSDRGKRGDRYTESRVNDVDQCDELGRREATCGKLRRMRNDGSTRSPLARRGSYSQTRHRMRNVNQDIVWEDSLRGMWS